jgi:hypothetical protein
MLLLASAMLPLASAMLPLASAMHDAIIIVNTRPGQPCSGSLLVTHACACAAFAGPHAHSGTSVALIRYQKQEIRCGCHLTPAGRAFR